MSIFDLFYHVQFLGSDIKGGIFIPDASISMSLEDHALYFFGKYSKDLLVEVGVYTVSLRLQPELQYTLSFNSSVGIDTVFKILVDRPVAGFSSF